MKKLLRLLLINFLAFNLNGFSQAPGYNDSTFNPGDFGYGNGDGFNGAVYRAVIQNDGKIVAGGQFGAYNNVSSNHIIRLNTDGTRDTSFHVGTGADNDILAIAIQSDGKIIIGGYFLAYNGTPICRIARLNSDGSIDPTFNTIGGANNIIRSLLVQPDGKIIVGGEFTFIAGVAINRIAKLNSNGSVDNTFNPSSGANNTVYTIALQPDGKIIAGGQFTIFNGYETNGLVRLNTNGSMDGTFNIGAGTNAAVNASVLQSDGKLIIGGLFLTYNGTTVNRITRLNTNGSMDPTFNSGTGANSGVYEITTQSDGKIMVGGLFTTYNGTPSVRIMRLDTGGSIDPTFNTGIGATNTVASFAFQSDGKILVGGYFQAYNNVARPCFMRLENNGVLDRSYNVATGVTGGVCSISLQPDGKIILGGLFEAYNNRYLYRIARANIDGSVDTTFNVGTGANNTIYATALQSDGKIIIGGYFTTFNGSPKNYITRLNSDGSLDTTFVTGTGPNNIVKDIAIQPNGKIIIVGTFTVYDGTNANRIVRLNSNGSIDATFNIGTGANNTIFTTSIQLDGNILIGGYFTNYNGTNINRIARLNTNGSLDGSFTVGTGANSSVFETGIQSDGKIIIAGDFLTYSGQSCVRLARLNTNGTLDPTFTVAGGVDNIIETFALQSDDKIVIAGYFGSYNGVSRNRIARINTNGTLDVTFNPGIGASNHIDGIAIQSDGKILIGGFFMEYNSVGRNRIARIHVDCGEVVVANITPTSNLSICGNTSTFLITTGSGTISWFTSPSGTLSIATGSVFNTPNLSSGSYTYYAEAQTSCTVSNARESITITASPNPTVTVNSGTICAGDSYTIIPNGASTYSYSSGSDVVSPTIDDTYTIIGTDINGCENTATSSVTVNSLPLVMATTNNTLLCTGETATLTANGATSYTWSTNEITNNIAISPTSTTTYTLNGIGANGCSNTFIISQDVDLCTGIVSFSKRDVELNAIYPNPTNGFFTIELNTKSHIIISNALGQIALTESLNLGKHNFDIKNQQSGIYFVKVVSDKNQQTFKIIKE